MVAHNPLHGSGRAALLHPALALGNNAKALPRIRVTNVSLRDPASHSALHLSPGDTGFLATALKHPPPEPSHGHAKVTDRHRIHRHRVIAHISENHRAHILPHCGNRRVHASPEFGFDFLEFALPSLAHRLPQHHESSLTGLRAAVSETQKVRSEEHTSELQSPCNLVCRLLLEKKKNILNSIDIERTYSQRDCMQ